MTDLEEQLAVSSVEIEPPDGGVVAEAIEELRSKVAIAFRNDLISSQASSGTMAVSYRSQNQNQQQVKIHAQTTN